MKNIKRGRKGKIAMIMDEMNFKILRELFLKIRGHVVNNVIQTGDGKSDGGMTPHKLYFSVQAVPNVDLGLLLALIK